MDQIIEHAICIYSLQEYTINLLSEHEGGRNWVYICSLANKERFVLRISFLSDRSEEDFLAETEFIHYLASNKTPVADVVKSKNGNNVENIIIDGSKYYLCLFEYADGILIADNGYRYRENVALEEYFFNTGKVLGAIHRLSKQYQPHYKRVNYFDKYNMEYISLLIPKQYNNLLTAIKNHLDAFRNLPTDSDSYGLVHFDFNDGNYHIDMETGKITVFDFDNCINCWYMFDLATLWINGTGWYRFVEDAKKREECMKAYFATALEGYKSETGIKDELLNQLPLFIDMVLIENIVDEAECCKREGNILDYDDIADKAEVLINGYPYIGFLQ